MIIQFTIAVLASLLGDAGEAAATLDFAEVSLDGLLKDHDVTTSGLAKMRMSEVPESIWVLTAEEIRRSGATNVPEALRLVPALGVVEVTPGHYEVSSRYFESYLGNRILLMIDSRPAYVNFRHTNMWSALPVTLEEIDRIEVILGPDSTLYGSNAMNGLINIITKLPDQRAIVARAIAGPQIGNGRTNLANGYGSAAYWDRFGAIAVRAAASYSDQPPWEKQAYANIDQWYRATRSFTADTLVRWDKSTDTAFTLRGGANSSQADYIAFYRSPYSLQSYFADGQFKTDNLLLKNDTLTARIYCRNYQLSMQAIVNPNSPLGDFDGHETSTVLAAMYQFGFMDKFATTVGVEGQLQTFNYAFLAPNVESQKFLSTFVQERVNLLSNLTIAGGVRLENEFLAGKTSNLLAPSGSIVYAPAAGHVLRLYVGRAFATPSLLEEYGDLKVAGITLLSGNQKTKIGQMTSAELGYQYSLSQVFTAKIGVFYSVSQNNMNMFPNPSGSSVYIIENLPSLPGRHDNLYPAYGGEFGLTIKPLSTLGITAGYAMDMNQEPSYAGIPQGPLHKATLSINANPHRDWECDLNAYFLSLYQGPTPVMPQPVVVNPVDIVNVRVAYRVVPKLKIVATGHNVVPIRWGNTFHAGATNAESQSPGADIIGQRYMLGLEGAW